jgi:hypothetical protein
MTITHGKPGKYITTSTHNNNTGVRGYYLVLPNGDRHWIGETTYDAARAIDKACDKHLRAEDGYEYWIDYCHGYDVKGNLAWANVDQSDIILHRAENI